MTTLVERLRSGQEIHDGDWSMLDDAIERIEELERQLAAWAEQSLEKDAQIALLREALEEIAWSNNTVWQSDRAKAALAATEEKK